MQTYPRIEHIVIDGGSTDGTVEILHAAQEKWGVQWSSGPDGGMYEALNAGLDRAAGEIVGWVNSDDWLLPWTVASVVGAMQSLDRPHAIFGDALSIDVGQNDARVQVFGKFTRSALGAGWTIAQPTVFWPLQSSRRIGGLDTRTYRQLADCQYWLRLAEILPFHKVDEFLALVQDHPKTKRSALQEQILNELGAIRRDYETRAPRPIVLAAEALRRRAVWLRLLLGFGWHESLDAGLLDASWATASRVGRLRNSGPWRRHPLANESVNVTKLRGEILAICGQLLD